MSSSKTSRVETIFLYTILATSSIVMVVLAFYANSMNVSNAIALPLMLIFGVIIVFSVLTLAGKIFVSNNFGCSIRLTFRKC